MNSRKEILNDLGKTVGFTRLGDTIEDLSPFTDDQTPTPLCVAPCVQVTKRGHNIMYSLACVGFAATNYMFLLALILPWNEEKLTTTDNQELIIHTVPKSVLALASASVASFVGAGITFFCTKVSSDGNSQEKDRPSFKKNN